MSSITGFQPVFVYSPLSVLFYKILGTFLFGKQRCIYFNVMFYAFRPVLKDGLLNFGCVWLKASNVCKASR